MKFRILFSFVFSCAFIGWGQPATAEISVSGHVLDLRTKEAIPYAYVWNTRTRKGTISNLAGFFQLDANNLQDTLAVSFTGYDRQYLVVSHCKPDQRILLQSKVRVLETVSVTADGQSYLYRLIADCHQKAPPVTQTAKTYYELESFADNRQAELISGYYNGDYKGYELEELHLKDATIDLAAHQHRLFMSSESSHALCMFKLFGNNKWFPETPFSVRKSNLAASFEVTLDQKYRNEDGHPVYVIDFMPRDTNGRFFQGRVWIDSLESHILRIQLKASNAKLHPFMAFHSDSLQRVDLEITRTFEKQGDYMLFNHMDFKYDIWYRSHSTAIKQQHRIYTDSAYRVSTHAVLYAYDYANAFLLPKFKFSGGMHEDYRNAIFYNAYFWTHLDEFKLHESGPGKTWFIRDSANITSRDFFSANGQSKSGFLEHPYTMWSPNRIRFRSADQPPQTGTPVDLYHFEVQLYVDLNPSPEGLNMFTKVVFDPFESFFHFPPADTAAVCFLNLYFDLMEIQRREFEAEVRSGPMEAARIQQLYDQRIRQMKSAGHTFLKETERGRNEKAMLKWNRRIQEKLGIDNVTYFGIFREAMSQL
jgi:hypothetical protein